MHQVYQRSTTEYKCTARTTGYPAKTIPGVKTFALTCKGVATNGQHDRFCVVLTALPFRKVISTVTVMLKSHVKTLMAAMILQPALTPITVLCTSLMTFQEEMQTSHRCIVTKGYQRW